MRHGFPCDDSFVLLDIYDGATAAGCFCPGHIQPDALYELLRIVKPGKTLCELFRICKGNGKPENAYVD